MSREAMENALRLYEDSRPMHSVLPQARDGFREGWAAAMRFTAQPRIPAPDVSEPVKPGEFRERNVGQMPVCPKCGSSSQVWKTNHPTSGRPLLWCNRAGCCCEVPEPRIPALTPTPIQPEPNPVAQRFVEDEKRPEYNCPPGGIPLEPEIPDPDALRFAEDPSRPGFLRRCHNPHGLVAFYTDAPVKPWGNTEGRVDHPKGCACGLCEQEDEDTHS